MCEPARCKMKVKVSRRARASKQRMIYMAAKQDGDDRKEVVRETEGKREKEDEAEEEEEEEEGCKEGRRESNHKVLASKTLS